MFSSSGPLTEIKLMPDSLAIALASSVLPNGTRDIEQTLLHSTGVVTDHIRVDPPTEHRAIEQTQSDRTVLDDE